MNELTKKRRKGLFSGRWILWCLALSALGLVFVGLAVFRSEFTVDGTPFVLLVAQRPDFAIEDPLAKVGTKAIPALVRILHRPGESTKAYKAKSGVWNLLPPNFQARFNRFRPISEWQIKRTALFGLRFFGPEAEAALPDVIRYGRSETNPMVRSGGAVLAALNIAPRSPETYRFWREEWEHTNYFTRHDFAIYIGAVPET